MEAVSLSWIALAVATGGLVMAAEPEEEQRVRRFARPVMLVAGERPLGRDIAYPSPTLFDVDRDGQAELVIGDLRGSLHVAERQPELGPQAWSEPAPLVGSDGCELDFSNW